MHLLSKSFIAIGYSRAILRYDSSKFCQRLLSTVTSENSTLKSAETAVEVKADLKSNQTGKCPKYIRANSLILHFPFTKVEEVEIKVPWGHLSGKWWGPRDVRPVLALHGWQDNAGTFDNLIPRLPKHLSYLSLDLPGHGLSSRIPDGQFYSTANILHVINTIRHHYKWEKVSLMAHSMGSMISFQFSALFPGQCDLVIGLDALKPHHYKPTRIMESLPKIGDEFYRIDQRNQQKLQPPSYSYDDLIDRWVEATRSSITKEVAPILMKRAVAPSPDDPNKFYFTRDSRLKVFNFSIISQELSIEMAKRIQIPYMFVKAIHSPYYENKRYFDEVLQVLIDNNPKFEFHLVDGTHHFHLTKPSLVDKQISEFLLKYRPV